MSTQTSWSMIGEFSTDDAFDLIAKLLDQFQGQKSHGYDSLSLDDDPSIDLGKRPLAQEVSLAVFIFSIFQCPHLIFNDL